MVVGILAIFMCNTVYCPLNPYDPTERHRILLKETQAKAILVHKATSHLFSGDDQFIKLQIDQQQNDDCSWTNKIKSVSSSIAFVVFTSGSTGTPKGVPISHINFLYYITSMHYERYLLESDIILQVSRDTFDAHLQEILGAVLLGGTCVLLRPSSGANLNVIYLTDVIQHHQVTIINLVPSLAIALIDHLNNPKRLLSSSLRLVISTGKTCLLKSV
jgi:non-ribosomal peptide synthetase component F